MYLSAIVVLMAEVGAPISDVGLSRAVEVQCQDDVRRTSAVTASAPTWS